MNRIKEVLEEKGIKQTWLAEKLGKSFSIVNSYVCNRRQPSLETLFRIAEILGVDVKELISHKTIIINYNSKMMIVNFRNYIQFIFLSLYQQLKCSL